MILSINTAIDLLTEIGSIYDYQCIITGSCADMFHIGYTNIEDIDLTIDYNTYNFYNNRYHPNKKLMISSYSLIHKTGTHEIHRYFYKQCGLDLMIKNKSEIDTEIVDVHHNNIVFKVFSHKARLKQLINNSYNEESDNYESKIKKVSERIEIYKKILSTD